MRARITIRGKRPISLELRGYYDYDSLDELGEFANDWEGYGLVIASPAPDDYNPFPVPAPIEHPPTMASSHDLIHGIVTNAESQSELIDTLAELHFMQARVIRGERARAEAAEHALMTQ